MMANEEIVNGKLDMGFRRLFVSHVENATTLYAYVESESQKLQTIKQTIQKACSAQDSCPSPDQIVLKQVYAVNLNNQWIRGSVEQKNCGYKRNLFKIKCLDVGSIHWVNSSAIAQLPVQISEENLPVLCLRYKMADLKAKGREDGFTAADREMGADWLRSVIGNRQSNYISLTGAELY